MKFNEYLSVLAYKLVLVMNLINGGAFSEKDKTGKYRIFSPWPLISGNDKNKSMSNACPASRNQFRAAAPAFYPPERALQSS